MGTQLYKAFLIRLQRDDDHPHWRATIENVHTGERLRFADQNQMLRYLLNDLADKPTPIISPTDPVGKGEG